MTKPKLIVPKHVWDGAQAEQKKNEITKKSRLIIKLKDYWKGNLQLEEFKYDLAIQGFSKRDLEVLIKPDSLEFDKKDYVVNENYSYRLKDSIQLGNQIYIIDNISNDVTELILKAVEVKPIYGFRTGQTIKKQLRS